MLPCFICGEDASTGWIKGFVPSPDSQKVALCKKHDTPENRKKAIHHWCKLMLSSFKTVVTVEATRPQNYNPQSQAAHQAQGRILNIRFISGGVLSLACNKYQTTNNNTLEVTLPDGSMQIFPLQHVRNFELSPASKQEISFGPPPKPLQVEQKPLEEQEKTSPPEKNELTETQNSLEPISTPSEENTVPNLQQTQESQDENAPPKEIKTLNTLSEKIKFIQNL
ncbi:hypothetical protein [Desulfovibrio litoralis]|uniref:Uncharacterized protein n=1 Tax=Desulfovibrio litoralis DSM 11393 TaxID=1121455 RepID=A0A1M7SA28_9BACT|nr:hypothetical protein [Desulfovibrio litoralis]SHN55457.1 hypothetical protein SAMN02745728_00674 [Desulfovibrio litoralis DSM 11393]